MVDKNNDVNEKKGAKVLGTDDHENTVSDSDVEKEIETKNEEEDESEIIEEELEIHSKIKKIKKELQECEESKRQINDENKHSFDTIAIRLQQPGSLTEVHTMLQLA